MTKLANFVGKGVISGLSVGASENDVKSVIGTLGEKAVRSELDEYVAWFGAVQISFNKGFVSLIQLDTGCDFDRTPVIFHEVVSEVSSVVTFLNLVELFEESEVDWWVDGPSCIGRVVCLRTDKVRAFFNLDRNELQGIMSV